MKKNLRFAKFIMVTALVSLGVSAQVFAYTLISSQLDVGERNNDVTSLQGFFTDNSSIYPEGLITGYFGGLTRSAVMRFQAQYGLDQVGRVGPMTRDKINSLINQGGWVVSDIAGPWIYSVNRAISSSAVTLTWNTNENATGKVFYNTSPITMNEGDMNSVGFGSTNGFTATNDGLARMSQQVTIGNLQPNTLYYYVVVSTDLAGNVSLVGPNDTFRTNSQ